MFYEEFCDKSDVRKSGQYIHFGVGGRRRGRSQIDLAVSSQEISARMHCGVY